MPVSEFAGAGEAEDEWRCDQPQAERKLAGFLPALQTDVLEFSETKHEHADQKRIRQYGWMVLFPGEPGRQPDQHTKQHAHPFFPRPMNAEKTNALESQRPGTRPLNVSNDRQHVSSVRRCEPVSPCNFWKCRVICTKCREGPEPSPAKSCQISIAWMRSPYSRSRETIIS